LSRLILVFVLLVVVVFDVFAGLVLWQTIVVIDVFF
jgi:hypothetical protein